MVKRTLKFLLTRPVTTLANRFSSAPKKENVFTSLSKLYEQSVDRPGKKSGSMFSFNPEQQSIIIFSDQHKGTRNGSDDFRNAELNYLAALDYYDRQQFYYVNLGDCEELWENSVSGVIKANSKCFEKEMLFIARDAYTKIIGNHDLFWKNDLFAQRYIKNIYGQELKIFEGIVLRIQLKETFMDVFCTHGHQGDTASDGNAFSKWFVSNVWGPLQSFLEINPNTPSTNDQLKTIHNQMMYEWGIEQPNLILITGHTHQPVFRSLTHLERLYLQLEDAEEKKDEAVISKIKAEIPRRRREYDFVNHSFRSMIPTYFNSGCCCFGDGTITGIEIEKNCIRLVKWSYRDNVPTRIVAEEALLIEIAEKNSA
jgi:predicted phosphodiesterase